MVCYIILQEVLSSVPTANDIPVRHKRNQVNGQVQSYNDDAKKIERDLR